MSTRSGGWRIPVKLDMGFEGVEAWEFRLDFASAICFVLMYDREVLYHKEDHHCAIDIWQHE